MARTDRLKGLITRGVAFGGFLIGYVRFFPRQISGILGAPLYVGYQISLLFGLGIGFLMGFYYILSAIKDEVDRLEENLSNEELKEMLDESSEESEKVSTDGGKRISDGAGKEKKKGLFQKPDSLIDRFVIEPNGQGAFGGIVIGVFLGFLFGPNGIIVGGILGGLVGNEVEYQAIRKKRKSVLGLEEDTKQGSLSTDVLYDLLRYDKIRLALKILFRKQQEMPLSELAEEVASLENENIDAGEKKSIYVALYQAHLPNLQEAGIVDWDASNGIVSLGRKSNEIKPYLQQEDPQLDVSKSKLYDILKNRRRRLALQLLIKENGSMKLSELAEQIASYENDKPVAEISATERKSVYVSLYQSHLPKLDQAGFVDYNQSRGIVEPNKQTKDLTGSSLEVPTAWFSWDLYYAVLSIIFVSVFVTREVGLVSYSAPKLNIIFIMYSVLIAVPALYKTVIRGYK